jgi:HD-GYP domain-containing protein (c-di-GMP phosphodiesterase class II)
LRRCAGSQFDPDVVDTLVGVLGDRGVGEADRHGGRRRATASA